MRKYSQRRFSQCFLMSRKVAQNSALQFAQTRAEWGFLVPFGVEVMMITTLM